MGNYQSFRQQSTIEEVAKIFFYGACTNIIGYQHPCNGTSFTSYLKKYINSGDINNEYLNTSITLYHDILARYFLFFNYGLENDSYNYFNSKIMNQLYTIVVKHLDRDKAVLVIDNLHKNLLLKPVEFSTKYHFEKLCRKLAYSSYK